MASPHEKYMQQLIEIEKELYGETTIDFHQYQSTSIQANLRRIRQQHQTTQQPFQEGHAAVTNVSASICLSSTSSSDTNGSHSAEITAQMTQTSAQQYLPQFNLKCTS